MTLALRLLAAFALRLLAAFALLAFASHAPAAFHLFRIQQLYSNADGTIQFVVLGECCGGNGEHLWAGQQLVASSAAAGTRTFSFPRNLPSSATAARRVLVATQGYAALGVVTPDFIIPDNFIPVGGGSLNYAGVHQVTFGPLPTDGVNALSATGQTVVNLATNFAGQSGSVSPGPATALAIEYYNAALDHYFITHVAAEIAILDAGVQIRGWARTLQSFRVYAASGTATFSVCRYYLPPHHSVSTRHGPEPAECSATGQRNPTFVNEDPQFFHAVLPAAGTCPGGTVPLYRVFSNRPDANHRYMADRTIRDRMVSEQRWLAEGDGPDLVVMCVPPAAASAVPPELPENPGPTDPYPPGYGSP